METIVIDKNYRGVYEFNSEYRLDNDIILPNNINITIPLYCTGNIVVGGHIKSNSYIKVDGRIDVEGYIKSNLYVIANGFIRAGGCIEVNGYIKSDYAITAGSHIKAIGSIEATSFIRANGYIESDTFIRCGGYIKSDRWISVLGEKTTKYLNFQTDKYLVTMTDNKIGIDYNVHTIQWWKAFTDDDIIKMGSGMLPWWNHWKDFILSAHEKLPAVYSIVEN